MHPTNAMLYARQMLDAQGLKDWGFRINTNKRRCGVCKYHRKRVEISTFHLNSGEEAVKDTIGHEIAHAVVGFHHGHNHVWRSKAIELGSKGNRCGTMEVSYKWQAICPHCGVVNLKHRRPSRLSSCRRCSNGVFNYTFLLHYQPNHEGLTFEDILK